ncbi:MAG: HAD family phosphatase [Candidatus Marinimicrobia bacterium]|nr:HAD family phosphatase [Candidatus Neomarinimicrobiota bacterium]
MNQFPDIAELQAVLFDFDGVVVQSEDVYDRVTEKLAAHYDAEIPSSFCNENRGIAIALFYQRFKTAIKLNIGDRELEENCRRILWDEFSTSVQFTQGFNQFFDKIRGQVPQVALVTATSRPLIEKIFQSSNITVDFDQIVTANDVKRDKPAPDPYLMACTLLGVKPGRALVIEDSPTGLRSATEAGCQTVGITTSCDRESLKEANFVVDSFGELEELLTIV